MRNAEFGMRNGVRDLKVRTKQFALRVMRLTDALPRSRSADVLGRQLLRAGTSVGANYRAACRARSVAEFLSKMGQVEEEIDECVYWFELLMEGGIVKSNRLQPLHAEANELAAITVASIRTARKRK